jgi:hypothetical protein
MASPTKTAPRFTNENSASHLVDLTTEDEVLSPNLDSVILSPPYATKTSKRHKKQLSSHPKQNKSVQWRSEEVNHYNPEAPAAKVLPSQHMTNQPNFGFSPQPNPPIFPPAPAPLPLLAPSMSPFYNQQQNIYNSGAHNLFLKNQNPMANPFLLNANPKKNTNYRKRGRNRWFQCRPQH